MRVEKISAVTLWVTNMQRSVRFYRDVLGMDPVYGGEDAFFSSLRARGAEYPILNLEQGRPVSRWGRMIFYVADVDAFWIHLKERGFDPERPHDASWGERYFHMCDRDGPSCRLPIRCGLPHEHGEAHQKYPHEGPAHNASGCGLRKSSSKSLVPFSERFKESSSIPSAGEKNDPHWDELHRRARAPGKPATV